VIGSDLGLKHDKALFKDLMPKMILPPMQYCQAMVKSTIVAHFEHMDTRAETIRVEVPAFMKENLKVEIKKMNVVH